MLGRPIHELLFPASCLTRPEILWAESCVPPSPSHVPYALLPSLSCFLSAIDCGLQPRCQPGRLLSPLSWSSRLLKMGGNGSGDFCASEPTPQTLPFPTPTPPCAHKVTSAQPPARAPGTSSPLDVPSLPGTCCEWACASPPSLSPALRFQLPGAIRVSCVVDATLSWGYVAVKGNYSTGRKLIGGLQGVIKSFI